MKIGLLGAACSVHLQRIANALAEKKIDVVVITIAGHEDIYDTLKCKTIILKHRGSKGYYLNALSLKKIIKEERITLLNAHYASGYGTLGRLSGFHPTILSVWGSDIFSFPKENYLKKRLLIKNLLFADELFSTSSCMANEIKFYIGQERNITITPFGVNVDSFVYKKDEKKKSEHFVIGFMKGTDPVYGVDIFLQTMKMLQSWGRNNQIDIKGIICGKGSNEDEFIQQVKQLKLNEMLECVGLVSHGKMPNIIKKCDIICIPSREESFGVVALESMASGVPCIVSDAPGLKEVVIDNQTGYVVANKAENYVEKIKSLIFDSKLRELLSIKGRTHVEQLYDFDKNLDIFIKKYQDVINANK